MTPAEVNALWPFIILAAAPVVVMLAIAGHRQHRLTATLTLLSLGAAFISLLAVAPSPTQAVSPLLMVDGYALFYMGLIIAASAVVAALAYGYLAGRPQPPEEFYVVLLLAVLGATVLVASRHFVSFLLGLEILSVSLYALIAYPRQSQRNIEAGLKYLVLAATASAFLLFGLAWLYAVSGTMDFLQLAAAIQPSPGAVNGWALAGLSLVLTGLGFKLAVVPFHLWAPDVYEGAPAPVSALIATVSKGSLFALLLRLWLLAGLQTSPPLVGALTIIAVMSMFAGNLLALLQNNVKRLLAYSSISHLGYLLVALLASGPLAATAATFYLVAYFVTNLGAFGVITLLSNPQHEADALEDYTGLVWRRPWLAGILTAMLFSLAGIPLTAGFVGKFLLVAAGTQSAMWGLVLALVVSSLIGLFYYLRLVVTMYQPPAAVLRLSSPAAPQTLVGGLAMALLILLLVWLGVFPDSIIRLINLAVASLGA